MAEPESLLQKLLARRVPQILGLYIAAAWLIVEMGEWITGLLGWPDQLVIYAFVLMSAFLPGVVLLAWHHGRPGRDKWQLSEKIWLPINVVLALAAVAVVMRAVPPGVAPLSKVQAEPAVTQRILVDETGTEQVYSVARDEYRKRVAAFFWTQQGSGPTSTDQWHGYAIAWLLAVDLGRDPLLTVFSPYSLDLIQSLKAAGFDRALGEPLSLDIRLARDADADLLVRGQYSMADDGVRLDAQVADAESGRIVAEHAASASDLVTAVARLSEQLAPALHGDVERDPQAFLEIPLAEAASASPDALEALIEGMNAIGLDRNTDAAEAALRRAVSLDPDFALAHVRLAELFRSRAELQASAQAMERALALDYKLGLETRFALKANRYAVLGDYDKAMRVLEMWTEVHPDSLRAHIALAGNMVTMGRADAARPALERARALDPDNADIDRIQFRVEMLSGDFEEAARQLRSYIDREPEDVEARLDLGELYMYRGDFERARDVLEQAALIASDPFRAELQHMVVDARAGRLREALARMTAALTQVARSDNLAELVVARYRALSQAGRFSEVLNMARDQRAALEEAFPAAGFWMLSSEMKAQAHSALGDVDAALAVLEEGERQLGEPMGRYLSINRLQVLFRHESELPLMERELERLRFFEENFSFPGMRAYVNLAEALVAERRGDSAAAVESMRSALEEIRSSGMSLDLSALDYFEFELARLLGVHGEGDEARNILERLLARHPAHGPARLELARVEIADDRAESARVHLERLMTQWADADPEYIDLRDARRMLDSL